ncbi:MAG TPA: peptide ABC transporter substrate-binding protein [Caldilineaceae bacterium]|nr:peptide ABC transporter substrate-binding protein [Caldilineaceae bacterium]
MSRGQHRSVIVSLAAMLLLAFAGCTTAPQPAPAAPAAATSAPAEEAASEAATEGEAGETVIIYGLYQEPEILNPFIRTQTAATDVGSLMDEGLLEVDPDGNFIPNLATEVPSVENGLVSEDGLTITYNLREDVLWSDGEPFTCDDVVFTWEAITHPDSGAVSLTGYDQIESVTCEGDYRVIVQYSTFYAPFLTRFDAILPRHATGDPADMPNWEYNWAPIGTGPFVLEEWVQGDRMVFVKNENYRFAPELPRADRIIIRIIPSREVGKALITSGEIDILWDLTEADTPEFEANPDVVVNNVPSPGTERLVLNLADPTLDGTDDPLNNPHPLLGDLRVRQAIQYGIDKQFIVDELLYGATTVGVSELSLGWAKCDIAPSVYDPEQAMALLEEAGFTDQDGDGSRECHGCQYAEEGTPLRLKFQTTSGNQLREETQQIIVEMMREIGIEFYIENVPSAELFGSWESGAFRKHGNFDVLMYTTNDGIDPHEQMYGYFHSASMPTEANAGAGFNYSRWVNAEADAALDAADDTPDLEARRAAYQRVCELIDAELPHIYLYDRAEIHLSRANITGFVVSTWGPETWNAEEWDKQ